MASTYLYRTSGTATSTQKFTVSAWVKQCLNPSGATDQAIWGVGSSNTNLTYLRLRSADNSLQLYIEAGGTEISNYVTNRLFRDVNGWYHTVLAVDTTQSTAANRVKIYVNGVQETSFSSSVVPSVNHSVAYLSSNLVNIGRRPHANNNYFDGSMANVEFVDGTALTPAYFGSTDSNTGIWTPQASSTISDYGTNGFKLKMDTTSPGADTSGKGNTFTASGTPTLTQGSPSNVYATMNPLDNYFASSVFSNGNLTLVTNSSARTWNNSTIGVTSGKYYCEMKSSGVGAGALIGIIATSPNSTTNRADNNPYAWVYLNGGSLKNNGSTQSGTWASWVSGDIIGLALDLDNNKIYFSKNGVWQNTGSANPSTGTDGFAITAVSSLPATQAGCYFIVCSDDSTSNNATFDWNFGSPPFAISSGNADGNGYGNFEYAVPTGYFAICTKNLSEALS